MFLFVPFSAINSFLLFRKKRLNLSEHCILSGMILLGVLLISVLAHLYFPINYMLNFSSDAASYVVIAITLVYISFGYYNAFRNLYSTFALLLRVLLLFVLLFTEIFLLFMLSYGYVTHWKFGEIHVTPFG
ncbi:hypothetical protein CHX27_05200 [Flavobacterium aurantiibacter]|uniref:Uncharacterized protein n=2 Tax=Flavobacterium aurantiibacter TaxID=2023067 RepID=A0A255ZYV3_9FLAO|nr:hypothetical protein CHX27_05200 [Flavobacterium aurantiibacter]